MPSLPATSAISLPPVVTQEERSALVNGPLATAEQRVADLEEVERRSRALVERKVRQAAEMAAAVQTLGADSRMRIEENVKLRLLAQRLGATEKELRNSRRTAVPQERAAAERAHTASAASRSPSLATAWVPPTGDEVMRAGGSPYTGSRSRSSPGNASATNGHSPVAPMLESQSALQEKLRKVRATFADIRKQVGYDDERGY